MKTLTNKLYLTCICVVLLGLTTAMAIDDGEKKATRAKLGEKVPDFKLNDTNGQERKLSDYKDRIVVLEWIDPKCEFVNNIYRTKAMQNAYKEAKAIDKSITIM